MRNISGGKVKMSDSEKGRSKQKHNQQNFVWTCDISSIKRVTRKLHVVVVQQQRQRNVQKSVLHVQSSFYTR